jgi:hypothetical protein
LLVPRLLAIASFGVGYGPLKELFAGRFDMSESASEFIAGTLVFFLPLATYFLLINIFAVWNGRASFARVVKVFAAYALVYLSRAALATVRDNLASPQCFLTNGQPRLFYSIQPGGAIELFDRSGFDRFGVGDGKVELFDGPDVNPATNEALQPVTPAVVEEVRHARALRNPTQSGHRFRRNPER